MTRDLVALIANHGLLLPFLSTLSPHSGAVGQSPSLFLYFLSDTPTQTMENMAWLLIIIILGLLIFYWRFVLWCLDVKRDLVPNLSCASTSSSVTAVSNCSNISTATSKIMSILFMMMIYTWLPYFYDIHLYTAISEWTITSRFTNSDGCTCIGKLITT